MGKELNTGAGFTLVELLVTIVVAAILLAVAVPSFRDYQASQQVRSTTADLVSAINLARSEAVKRMASTSVSPASGGWVNGWSVMSGVTVVRSYPATNGVTISGPGAALSYNRYGRAATATFTVAPSSSASVSPRCVWVSISGQPKSDKEPTGGCSS
jgi:type IV fimbrial biogenesis protein FimT